MIRLPLLDANNPDGFPDPTHALSDPNGLLAFGGDLSPRRLMAAYSRGIFPWFGEDDPVLWWSPDPRCVFHTEDLRINRSLRRQLAGKQWRLTMDQSFDQVIRACAEPRDNEPSTWIVPAMIDAYECLHRKGHAHSVEVWDGERLIGGIYGVAIGHLFCGESMFSRESGGSKLALAGLASVLQQLGFPLIDAQMANSHTLGLGAVEMPRESFLQQVRTLTAAPSSAGSWSHFSAALPQPCASNR